MTKPHKAMVAAAGALASALASAWSSGHNVTVAEAVTAVVLALATGGATWAKKNPPRKAQP